MTMKIQVCIGARDLRESGDYVASVSIDGVEVGRTELVANSSNPNWEKVLVLDVDEENTVTVGIISESDGSDDIGSAEFNVSSLLEKKVDGKSMDAGGFIFAFAAEHEVPGILKLNVSAKDLKNTEGFLGMSRDKSDPFIKIKGTSGDDVFTSDVLNNTLDPVWPEIEIQLDELCGGDLDGLLSFIIYDHDPEGSDDFMGKFQRSVNGLLSTAASGDEIDVNKNGKEAGNAFILGAELVGYVNPVDVGRVAIEAAATAVHAKDEYEAESAAAAAALEKAQKARATADEKSAHAQDLADQLADAEKAAVDAKAVAQKAADDAASLPATGTLALKLKGEKLKNTEGLFRKPDPFFALQKQSEAGEWNNVLVSDVIKDTLNPSWEEVNLDLSALGCGDLDSALRIVVFDQESDGKHELMGFFESSVNGLLSSSESGQSICMPKKGGTIIVAEAALSGYVDPSETKKKLKELDDKAVEAKYFMIGRKAAAKVASDAADEANNDADELSSQADSSAEEAAVSKAAAEEAASKLAAVVG